MSELVAGLQSLRMLLRDVESAAPRLFKQKLQSLLDLIENDVDHLKERSIDHWQATRLDSEQ